MPNNLPALPVNAFSSSVMGRDHVAFHKNNQDSFQVYCTEDGAYGVALVCDGCGSGNRSEVGAHLTSAFLAKQIFVLLQLNPAQDLELLVRRTMTGLIEHLRAVASWVAFGPIPPEDVALVQQAPDPTQFIREHLFATVVGFLWRHDEGLLLQMGDGSYCCGSDVVVTEQENAPHYPGYHILDPVKDMHLDVRPFKPSEVRQVAVATDGFHPELYPDALKSRSSTELKLFLNVSQRKGFCHDDATIAIGKWC